MTRKKGGGREPDTFFLGAHPVGGGYAGNPESGGRGADTETEGTKGPAESGKTGAVPKVPGPLRDAANPAAPHEDWTRFCYQDAMECKSFCVHEHSPRCSFILKERIRVLEAESILRGKQVLAAIARAERAEAHVQELEG